MSLATYLPTNPVYMPLSVLPEYQVSELLAMIDSKKINAIVLETETYIRRIDYQFYLEDKKEDCQGCK